MSLVVLLLAKFTTVFKYPVRVSWIVLAYIALTVLFVLLPAKWLEQKRARAIPELFDLLAISFLVKATGGLKSSWFILYVFPVMSASRYLGSGWSAAVAVLATLAYGYASSVVDAGKVQAIYSFCLRALVLGGAAFTAANLARTRDRAEAKLASRELESHERLQMLYKIGGQLKAEQGLDKVFQNVVTLVSERLGSEEAALFVPDDRGVGVKKVAVSGPDEETRKRRMSMECSYKKGESFTGGVFESAKPKSENRILSTNEYATDYSRQLPSGRAQHYLGVPIRIGDEVLGVIRALNKKAKGYSPQSGGANLAEEGFSKEDIELLETIATQVASAIRNARFLERTRYFENLVYNSPDPIIVIDKVGKIQNFNHECEKIWGRSEREALGTPVVDYYKSAEHAREINRALWKAEGHTIQNYETWIRDAQGNDIPIRLSATLLLDKYGQPAGSIGAFKDEREIRRLEEEKMRVEKLATLGRLAQTTGHDIKHNIASILNYVDSLERGAGGDPRSLQIHSAIRGATAAVLSKVQNMLMTANPKPPQKGVISLKSILTEFEASIAHEATVTRIDVSARYPKADALVLAEAEQMRQVVSILFGNSVDAIKSARAKGRRSAGNIWIILDGDQGIVRLSWRDDGCGMSESAKRNAFTPFYTTKKTGNGLGLFITKTVVENHGGQITVESSEGGGAWFRIELPRYLPSENAQTEASREA